MPTIRFAVILVFAGAAAAAAQPAIATAPPAGSLTTTAVRTAEAPTIDGDVAGDLAWANATPITAFWQEQPDEGQPASERTEVRVIFTADTLYIGAMLFDREPGGIIVSDARRDAPMTDTDSFQIIVDTYRDRQNGPLASFGAWTASRRPATFTSTTTGSSATAPRSTPG